MSTTAPRTMSAHNNLHALLFQATSAEYVALCAQAYQLARHALMARLDGGTFRNPAVVFDLDETVLDNSAYQAWQIDSGSNFDEKTSWRKWCQSAQAEAVPGAVEFIHFVRESGVTPIFITSRENLTRLETLQNLFKLGVISAEDKLLEDGLVKQPDAALHTRLFMKGMVDLEIIRPSGPKLWPLGNKFEQRAFAQQVRGFEMILSVGDNLSDYAEYYGRVYDPKQHNFSDETGKLPRGKHPNVAERRDSALQDMALFGRDFILIPNATYGGWIRAFEANKLGSSDELAGTGEPVRETLKEPQDAFTYANPAFATDPSLPAEITVASAGPKFVKKDPLRIWDGK